MIVALHQPVVVTAGGLDRGIFKAAGQHINGWSGGRLERELRKAQLGMDEGTVIRGIMRLVESYLPADAPGFLTEHQSVYLWLTRPECRLYDWALRRLPMGTYGSAIARIYHVSREDVVRQLHALRTQLEGGLVPPALAAAEPED